MKNLLTFILLFISIISYSQNKDSVGYYITRTGKKYPLKKVVTTNSSTFNKEGYFTFKYKGKKSKFAFKDITEYHIYGETYVTLPFYEDYFFMVYDSSSIISAVYDSSSTTLVPMKKHLCYGDFSVYKYSSNTVDRYGNLNVKLYFYLYQGTQYKTTLIAGNTASILTKYFGECNSVKSFLSTKKARHGMKKYDEKFRYTETICNCKD